MVVISILVVTVVVVVVKKGQKGQKGSLKVDNNKSGQPVAYKSALYDSKENTHNESQNRQS